MIENTTGTNASRKRGGVSRRRILQSGAALAGLSAGSGALGGFPTIWAQNIKDIVLRQAGSPVAAIPKIAEQANKDLGFTIQMQATENADLLNRFLSQSSAIDVGDVSIVFMKYLVGRNVLRVKNFLADLNERLEQVSFVAGEQFSAADITALVTIDFAAKAFAISTTAERDTLVRGGFGPDQHKCMRRIVFKPHESKRGDRREAFLETDDSGGRDT